MRFANNKFGMRVFIEDTKIREQYYCPICNEILITRMGTKRVHHFAHRKKGSTCHDSWHYDKSEWHKNWQNRFPQECQEIVKEFNGKRHRADVLLEDKKIVIEFQHSKISDKEFADRNDFYKSLGYKIIWLFDFANIYENDRILFYRAHGFELPRNKNIFSCLNNYYDDSIDLYFQFQNIASDNEIIIDCLASIEHLKESGYYIDEEHHFDEETYYYYNNHKNDLGRIVGVIRSKAEQEIFYENLEEYNVDQFVSFIQSGEKPKESIFNYIGSIYELWTIGKCNIATFYNTKTKFYVRIESDPEYCFEKYKGKCYGYISKDENSFNRHDSREIYNADKEIWKLTWKK